MFSKRRVKWAKPRGYSDSSYAWVKSHWEFALSLHSYDSVSGQQRPWPDCVEVQADLSLPCMTMPEDSFSMIGPN